MRGRRRNYWQQARRRSELDEIGAMRVALRLLEAEQYVLAALREEENAESGLAKCREAWQARESASSGFRVRNSV